MSDARIACLDQGSGSTKGAVFDAEGRVLAQARVPISIVHDGDRVEHDPEEVWTSVERTLAELAAGAGPLSAIGLCVQRSSCLLWQRNGARPLSPVVSWQDRRHAAAIASTSRDLADEVRRRTGLFLSPHYAAPKLRGLLDGVAGARSQAARGEIVAGTLDAWLVHRLTGVPSTEAGIAGRTLLYDLEEDAWSGALCDAFEIPRAALPPLRPAAGRRGEWHGVPVLAVAGDQQAALLGHGGWRRGVVAAHFGTGAFVLAATGGEVLRHAGLLSAVLAATAHERRFQIEGTVQSAGSAIDWISALCGVTLDALPGRPLAPERLPVVVPAFLGLGAPWWRPEARARIDDLELSTSAEDLVAATLVGVAQRVADNLEAMRQAGLRVETLRVSGRLTRRSEFVAIVAELGGCTIELAAEEESGLQGLARLTHAAALGNDAALASAATWRERHAPEWSEARRAEARGRWLRSLGL